MTWNLHLKSFFSYIEYQKRYSRHTLQAYEKDLQEAYEFFVINQKIEDIQSIRARDIRTWIYDLTDRGLQPKSINRKLSSLKSFFSFLVRKEVLQDNQASLVSSLKVAKKLPDYFEKNALLRLEDIEFGEDFDSQRDRLIVMLLYNAGLRCSEIVDLRIDQVDLSNRVIKVLGKGNKERVVPFSKMVADYMATYLSERNGLEGSQLPQFFITKKGKPIYPKLVYNTCDRVLAMISTKDKRNPHTLRHSFATHLLDEGAEINAIKELLGHSSLAATQVYTHNSISKLQKIYEKAHPRSSN